MTSEISNRDVIVARAKSDFGFLGEVAGKSVEVNDGPWRTVLAYTVKSITIEVELDWREQCAFVLVCRTVEGRRPPGYYMHEGRRMRVQFAQVLQRGSENDRAAASRVRSVTRKSGLDAMLAQLHETSSIMREQTGRFAEYHDEFFMD